ncbi:hypothetical protein CP880_10720 [Cutibacterium namnetense]|uniref:Uncharacterized protein n=1 Tax=Cutibacterium namnetense TaxID=1574624 RepID=A0ABX9I991_9ACTN|nr:hypothetical protein CP880_10720 [Cutibacterium namnetense]
MAAPVMRAAMSRGAVVSLPPVSNSGLSMGTTQMFFNTYNATPLVINNPLKMRVSVRLMQSDSLDSN